MPIQRLNTVTLKDGRRAIIIRTSDRISFKKCRRSWNWSSHLKGNWGPDNLASPLWFGSAIHFALEDYHGYQKFQTPADAFRAYCIATSKQHLRDLPFDAPELFRLGTAMMDYYTTHWLRHRKADQTFWLEDKHGEKIPQVEVDFEIEVPVWEHPRLLDYLRHHNADCVLYRGTIDRVAIDEYGRLWIVEYKTAKVVEHGHYQTDPQVTTYCVPLDTQILTRRGWQNYDNLVVGEEVLGYNQETGQIEWTKLTAVNTPGKQQLQKISNKSFEFRASEEHRWVRGIKHKGLSYKNNPKTSIKIDTLKGYKDNSYLILSAPYEGGLADITSDEAAVLGWLLTDGSWGEYTRGQRAAIHQKKYSVEVGALLNKFPGAVTRVTEQNGCLTWHLSMPWINGVARRAGLNMNLLNWEAFVLGLSKQALTAFCEAAMLGDGSIQKSGQKTFFQNKGPKQDLFRLAFFLTGVLPSKSRTTSKDNAWSDKTSCNTFSLTTPHKWMKTVQVCESTVEEVWCPTTELGTWIMRQGEQIAVTGNCWAGKNIYKQYGYDVAGVVYQQFVKKMPEPPKTLASGKISTASNLTTSATLYQDALERLYGDVQKAPDANREYLTNLMISEDEHRDKYIQRVLVERNDHMCAMEAQKILLELEDILNPDLPLYPAPTRDCSRMCSFLSPCVSFDDGGDWEYELNNRFAKRNQDADKFWRRRMPSAERLAQMRMKGLEPDLEEMQFRLQQLPPDQQQKVERGEEEISFTFNVG